MRVFDQKQNQSANQSALIARLINKKALLSTQSMLNGFDQDSNPAIAPKHSFSKMSLYPSVLVPPRLTINQPNDIYEQEADAMADKVMRMPDKEIPVSNSGEEHLQRKCKECEEEEKGLQRKENSNTVSFVSPAVDQTLRSQGQPIDTATRRFMESRFGHDFSKVQIHDNTLANQSAKHINALAYTHGSNIIFGEGQYQPSTLPGKKLLAHELTHVIQQGYQPVSASTPSISQHTVISGKTIQRSLFGGILGGIGGALGGALVGGMLGGPIGAIVGGVVGLVGGALIGDSVSTKSRSLTSNEITYAKEIFKNSIDYSGIKITRDSMLSAGAPRTIGNTIHLKSDWGHFAGDTMELTPRGKETLIHEMGHVWQYQNGGIAYIPESLLAQLKAKLSGKSRNAAYDWRAADAAKIPWEDWNPEQQAEAIEDYNKLLRKSKDGTATVKELAELSTLLGYMKKVWAREGAPTFAPMDVGNVPF